MAVAAIPLTTNYTRVATLAAVYGFAISANYSLASVILVELITLDSFTNAYGMLLLVQGFGTLVGPPVIGTSEKIISCHILSLSISGLQVGSTTSRATTTTPSSS